MLERLGIVLFVAGLAIGALIELAGIGVATWRIVWHDDWTAGLIAWAAFAVAGLIPVGIGFACLYVLKGDD